MTTKEANSSIISNTSMIDGAYYYAAKHSGVNENELMMLYFLYDGNEHSQHSLSQKLMMPKTTVNTVVKALNGRGLVTAEGEGKVKNLRLTPEGHDYAKSILAPIHDAEDRAMRRAFDRYGEGFIEAYAYLAQELRSELLALAKS